MEWINVQEQLPLDGEQVLGLIEGYFPNENDPLYQRRSFRMFQCCFFRTIGWSIPFCPDRGWVKYWMIKPDFPMSQ